MCIICMAFVGYVCVSQPGNLCDLQNPYYAISSLGDMTKGCGIKIGIIKWQRNKGNKEKQELEHRDTMRMYMYVCPRISIVCVPILSRKAERTVPFSYTCAFVYPANATLFLAKVQYMYLEHYQRV